MKTELQISQLEALLDRLDAPDAAVLLQELQADLESALARVAANL